MKRRRLSFSPILSPSRKLSRSSGTEPTIKIPTSSHEQQSFYDHEPVTPEDLDFPQKYYSLFNSGFDLGIVPSYTKLTRPDETEMIHEHSVLKFLNQVDNEDVVFFSRHLDINYS
ncbi:hypothetical protein G6F56_002734 [Rhizopus delemar]|uniref:Uncharacterized protein n=1 Tax=Rhizopus stolonifer TaxID=4846 RepID=A0A367KDF2_RHIST|nr:hypothetical protein G6F56_002734 [Rhizopus delemar]RCH99861.1 hypothetical protein CU098_003939 [Rhizopus stolonifer]